MPARARKAPTLQSASEPLDMPTLERHFTRMSSCDLGERLSSVFTTLLKEVALDADITSEKDTYKGTCAQLSKSVALILMKWVPYHVDNLQSVWYNCFFSFELLLRPEIPPCLVVCSSGILIMFYIRNLTWHHMGSLNQFCTISKLSSSVHKGCL